MRGKWLWYIVILGLPLCVFLHIASTGLPEKPSSSSHLWNFLQKTTLATSSLFSYSSSSSNVYLAPIWLGNCSTRNNYTSYAQLDLIQRAFPERKVLHTQLDSKCAMIPNISLHFPDVIFVMGTGFDKPHRDKISKVRSLPHWPVVPDQFLDLLYLHRSNLQPLHTRNRSFVIATQEEWWGGTNEVFDLLVDSKAYGHSGGIGLYWPFGSRVFSVGYGTNSFYRYTPQDLVVSFSDDTDGDEYQKKSSYKNAREMLRAKRGFVAFANSNCDAGWYGDATNTIRASLFDMLNIGDVTKNESGKNNNQQEHFSRKRVAIALGQCRSKDQYKPLCNHRKQDADCQKRGRYVSKDELDMIVDKYKHFKFVIAIENHLGPSITDAGYWTEKIVAAVLARAVPIYAGSQPLPSHFTNLLNPQGIIYCQFDFEEFSRQGFNSSAPELRIEHTKNNPGLRKQLLECVAQIKRVDEDDELWMKMASTPLLPKNKVDNSVFDLNRIGKNIRAAMCLLKSHLCPESDRTVTRDALS